METFVLTGIDFSSNKKKLEGIVNPMASKPN